MATALTTLSGEPPGALVIRAEPLHLYTMSRPASQGKGPGRVCIIVGTRAERSSRPCGGRRGSGRSVEEGSCEWHAVPAAFTLALTLLAGCDSVVEEHAEEAPRAAILEESEGAEPKEETLEEAIDLALHLMIEGRWEDLLARFLIPEEKEKLLREGVVELHLKAVAENYVVELVELVELMDCFKYIKGKTPKMSEDGTRATFDLRGTDNQRDDEITFVRIDGFWYIK